MFIGNTALSPPDILKGFDSKRYDLEFNSWLNDEWKPRQDELRQEILSYHANENRYIDLKTSFGLQQVVPFVGSGMSVPSGLPTWSAFLKEVGKSAQCDLSELEQLVCSSDFEEAADLIAQSMALEIAGRKGES